MKNILFLIPLFFLFFGTHAYADINYTRTPSGDIVTSPITIEVSFDDFTETGCDVSGYWSIIAYELQNNYFVSPGGEIIEEGLTIENYDGTIYDENTLEATYTYYIPNNVDIYVFLVGCWTDSPPDGILYDGDSIDLEYNDELPLFTLYTGGVAFGNAGAMVSKTALATSITLESLVPVIAVIAGIALSITLVSSLFITQYRDNVVNEKIYKEGQKEHKKLYKYINRNK